ncbi:hypothetical protein ACFFX0_03045 [Citricoccus parietis]|uniref:Uncharacterized protein n=1 Tax=Citricoccus parietis TaxID=592307 RepID=A0ABV5FUU1_9MICC
MRPRGPPSPRGPRRHRRPHVPRPSGPHPQRARRRPLPDPCTSPGVRHGGERGAGPLRPGAGPPPPPPGPWTCG